MNKYDYLTRKKFREEKIRAYQQEQQSDTKMFQIDCTHPQKDLSTSNLFEEHEIYNYFVYMCDRCGIHIESDKKIDDVKEIRKLLKEKASQ